jgi:hypothetical protein
MKSLSKEGSMKKVISYFLIGAILIAPNVIAVGEAYAADNGPIAVTPGAVEQLAQNPGEGDIRTTAACAGTGAIVGAIVFFPFGLLVGGAVGGIGCWIYGNVN